MQFVLLQNAEQNVATIQFLLDTTVEYFPNFQLIIIQKGRGIFLFTKHIAEINAVYKKKKKSNNHNKNNKQRHYKYSDIMLSI